MLAVQHVDLFGLGQDLPIPDLPIPSIPASVTEFPAQFLQAMRVDVFQPAGQSFIRLGSGMRKFGTGFLVIMGLGVVGWLTVRVLMGRPQLYFINAK